MDIIKDANIITDGNKLNFEMLNTYARRWYRTDARGEFVDYDWTFIDESGIRTRLTGSIRSNFIIWQTPPLPAFYQIFIEFHPNGYLSRRGKFASDLSNARIGEWRHYNEAGQLIKTIDEDAKFGKFGYNELLLLLHERGHINIKTGAGREGLSINFIPESKNWGVSTETNFWITQYLIDGQTGVVLKTKEMQGGII
jgi:hypothetical protein